MISTDRIACINPNCRRTAAREKYQGCTFIICAKCWKILPSRIRHTHKILSQRSKHLAKLARRPQLVDGRDQQWNTIGDIYSRACVRNNDAIKTYFANPPAPAGLENFLKETGLG